MRKLFILVLLLSSMVYGAVIDYGSPRIKKRVVAKQKTSRVNDGYWYVGIDLGGILKSTTRTVVNNETNATIEEEKRRRNSDTTTSGNGLSYGGVIGYTHNVLTPYVGLRYYINLLANHGSTDSKIDKKPSYFDYTANVDLLINFYTSPSFTIGVFGGIGGGGRYFFFKEISYGTIEDNPNKFTSQVNSGVRVVFGNRIKHSLEFIFNYDWNTYNFTANRMSRMYAILNGQRYDLYWQLDNNYTLATNPGPNGIEAWRNITEKYTIKHPYKLMFRYSVMF